MIKKFAKALNLPSLQCPLELFTEGNDDYTYVLPQCFAINMIDYGQLIKLTQNGRMVGKETRIIYGLPAVKDIETTDGGNVNSILCERLGRLVRKSKRFFVVKRRLVCAVELFLFYWNFVNDFGGGFSLGRLVGLVCYLWSWHEFFYCRVLSNLN
ncbi:MAG: hypothetical protein LBQ98_04975, partial [Nitrososphaerota archaeon]|jgi:hypothetical protein|nr:hypothetical protein [Nitrososphaerota archaeon]